MRPLDRVFDHVVRRPRRAAAAGFLAAGALAAASLVVTVHPGNTLSGLAAQHCGGQSKDWTGIYLANKAVIGANPNLIMPGQRLVIKCASPAALLRLGSGGSRSGKVWDVTYGYPNYCGDGDGDGWDVACANQASSGRLVTVSASQGGPALVNPGSYSGIESCIISRESGGNSQIWNASGHYGLFQFDYQTWVSGGGSAASFGHASVAEQQSVFNAVFAVRGSQPWSPSDGC